MPLFEYECQKCGQRTERIEKVAGPALQKCPKCGGKVERLISAPAIQFKGSGWYVTDYARKATSTDSAKTASEPSKGSDSKPAKSPDGNNAKSSGSKDKATSVSSEK